MFTRLMQRPSVRLWAPPTAGLLCYGGWAFLVNYTHGMTTALLSGLVQGSYSFIITLVLTAAIERLFSPLQRIPFGGMLIFVFVVLLLATLSTGINIVAGTPNILWTILPSLTVSAIYTALHLLALYRIK